MFVGKLAMLGSVASPQQLRKLALSLPETEEKSHFGKADFRVKNKIFAGLTEDVRRGYIKARPELQELLLATKAGVFSAAAGAWGRSGWTYIELPRVKLGMLEELLTDAWKLVAPRALVKAFDATRASQRKPLKTKV